MTSARSRSHEAVPEGSMLYSATAVSLFCGLPIEEVLRRAATGELPHEMAGKVMIVSKERLRQLMSTGHWNRHLSDYEFVEHFRKPEYSACPEAAKAIDRAWKRQAA